MFSQTSAFLTRSIRQESRLLSHHLVRGGMVLFLLFLLSMQVWETTRFGAAGLTLIRSVMNCCYGCLTLLGVMYFSAAITEEKEEETLPLLRMTGVRNLTLLLGKSLPRLAVVLLLILISAPFLLLAVTLGGVVPEQIFASIIGLICYAFCLCQAGLFASTVCSNNSRAVTATFLLWATLELGSWLVALLAMAFDEWGLSWVAERLMSIHGAWWERTMWQATGTYLMYDRGDSVWHPQMLFHLIIGVTFFALSHWLFERFNQHAIAQTVPITARGKRSAAQAARSSRCWPRALEWKSWQFVGGGPFWFWLCLIGLPVIAILVIVFISVMVGDTAPPEVYAGFLMTVGTAALIVTISKTLGSLFNREIHQQTLVSLCMLPESRGKLLKSMALGLAPFLIPPVTCFSLGFFLMAIVERGFASDVVEVLMEPWFWATLSWAIVTFHIGTFLSVWFRQGGMLIGIALCCAILPLMAGMFMATLDVVFRGFGRASEDFFQYIVPFPAMALHFAMCIILQRLIRQRIEQVAGS